MENKKSALIKIITIIAITSFLVLFFAKIKFQPRIFKKSQVLMGTVVNITIVDRNLTRAEKACEIAFKEMNRIEKMLSVKDKSSEIAKLNQHKDLEFVNVNSEVIFLLEESAKFSALTQGAFDISVGPLVELWKESLEQGYVPANAEIHKILPLVDYRNIEIDSRKNLVKFKKKGMKIDLGGIAKGYAVDRAIKVLRKKGVKNCLIEAGGDLFASGKGINKKEWMIGLRNPRETSLILEFSCTNKGVATSGDYERFKILNEKRYHQLIDPRAGLPESEIISATIVAPDAMTADALSTAVLILGKEKGMKLIKKTEDIEGVIIVKEKEDFRIFVSKTLEKSLRQRNPPGFLKKEDRFSRRRIFF